MINKFRLLKIRNNEVLYYNEDDVINSTNLYDLPAQEAIYNFSAEDQEIINNAAVDDGFYIGISKTGERMLVPYKRQNYILFFIVLFAVSIIMSVFTSMRYIEIGNITLYGSFLFFPLAFACTDIINELYGYNRVRNVISMTSLVLLIMAFLLEITLNLKGHLTDGSSDETLLKLLSNVPIFIGIYAVSIFISDSINAFLFNRIKQYLQGRALWLRSLTSTFIANFFNSIIITLIAIQVDTLNTPLNQVMDLFYSGHMVKMLYAICSLPFIYGAVYFVRNKEQEEAKKGVSV